MLNYAQIVAKIIIITFVEIKKYLENQHQMDIDIPS